MNGPKQVNDTIHCKKDIAAGARRCFCHDQTNSRNPRDFPHTFNVHLKKLFLFL